MKENQKKKLTRILENITLKVEKFLMWVKQRILLVYFSSFQVYAFKWFLMVLPVYFKPLTSENIKGAEKMD